MRYFKSSNFMKRKEKKEYSGTVSPKVVREEMCDTW